MTTERPLRASSALLAGLSLAIAVAAGTGVSAHRLDEYLQAVRIDVHADGVAIDLSLTPGADIAESIVATIDRDHDGMVTVDEQRAYATDVVRAAATHAGWSTASAASARLLLSDDGPASPRRGNDSPAAARGPSRAEESDRISCSSATATLPGRASISRTHSFPRVRACQ